MAGRLGGKRGKSGYGQQIDIYVNEITFLYRKGHAGNIVTPNYY